MARQIKASGRAYSVFDVARLFMQDRARFFVRMRAMKPRPPQGKPEAGAEAPPAPPAPPEVYECLVDGSFWLSHEEAIRHVLRSPAIEKFYRAENVTLDAPKGKFTAIAVCGFSGIPLGPPNHHDFQRNVARLHRERFSNMALDWYKSRVVIEKDEATLARWQESQTMSVQYIPLMPRADGEVEVAAEAVAEVAAAPAAEAVVEGAEVAAAAVEGAEGAVEGAEAPVAAEGAAAATADEDASDEDSEEVANAARKKKPAKSALKKSKKDQDAEAAVEAAAEAAAEAATAAKAKAAAEAAAAAALAESQAATIRKLQAELAAGGQQQQQQEQGGQKKQAERAAEGEPKVEYQRERKKLRRARAQAQNCMWIQG